MPPEFSAIVAAGCSQHSGDNGANEAAVPRFPVYALPHHRGDKNHDEGPEANDFSQGPAVSCHAGNALAAGRACRVRQRRAAGPPSANGRFRLAGTAEPSRSLLLTLVRCLCRRDARHSGGGTRRDGGAAFPSEVSDGYGHRLTGRYYATHSYSLAPGGLQSFEIALDRSAGTCRIPHAAYTLKRD